MLKEKWLIIDSHIHYIPKKAVSKAGISGGFDYTAPLRGEMVTSYGRAQDIEGMIQIMEDSGVDLAVLNQTAWSPQGIEMCKIMNDSYAEVGQKYPGKFILCGHVPLQQGQDVINEIDRCINALGIKGMALVSSMPDVSLDSPQMWTVYEKINDLDVPIVVHPTVRVPIWGGGKKYGMCWSVAREYDIAKATVEVMYGVLKDFPNLKFLMPHYGGGMPGQIGRLRAQYNPDNRNWGTAGEIKFSIKTPRELDEMGLSQAFDELFDKLYFDMAGAGGGWIPAIKAAINTIRTDRICFGTDYPYDIHTPEDIRTFITNIKTLDIPEHDKRLILGENIKRLFNI
ncbi:MAG: amidohydrolase family protein [Dehalococcoidia bacterium]|nr:amidohydrolase family protein [Dehalococcoidia bacterium]